MNTQDFDEQFSRKLRNLERNPRPQAFDRLSAQLAKPKKNRIAVWWTVSGVGLAASVILLLTLGKPETKTTGSSVASEKILPKKQENQVQNENKVTEKQENATEGLPTTQFSVKAEKLKQATQNKQAKNQAEESVKTLENQNLTNKTESPVLVAKTDFSIKNTALISTKPISIENDIEVPELKFVVLTVEEAGNIYELNSRKKTKAGRLVQQLGNLKQGKKADFKEFGLDKHALIATLKEKFN